MKQYKQFMLASLVTLSMTACVDDKKVADNSTTTLGSITHNGITYGLVASPYTGKVWLDRNLGAASVCTSLNDTACYGDYYQWGRNTDGHEDILSPTIAIQSANVNAPGSSFRINTPDWTSADSNGAIRVGNWAATDGSSVCPVGFRVPTWPEFDAEVFAPGTQINNSADAFNSFLVLPSAGFRETAFGGMSQLGTTGYIWLNTTGNIPIPNARRLFFDTFGSPASTANDDRTLGFPVRCLKN
jgi:uncharacterized protein (TIGR02145 family)